ncbi:MAG TPA: hypothetical protein VMP11_06320 [Verrucomicrobiae bacterium]|nr:hypothetical protein [Verrucomicrobiae bacterium]
MKNVANNYADLSLSVRGDLATKFAANLRVWFPGSKVTAEEAESPLKVDVRGLSDRNRRRVEHQIGLHIRVFRELDRFSVILQYTDANYKISRRLLEEVRTSPETLVFATTFFRSTIQSLRLDVLVTLAALFERPSLRAQTASIPGLLQFIRAHHSDLHQIPRNTFEFRPTKGDLEPLTLARVDSFLQLLNDYEGGGAIALSEQIVTKVREHRDRLSAHFERRHFLDISSYPQELVLKDSDVERLIAEAKAIVRPCWQAYEGGR